MKSVKINFKKTELSITTILRLIEINKSILFESDNNCVEDVHRWTGKWKEIYDQALKFELVPKNERWPYMRDVFWERCKKVTLKKIFFTDIEKSEGTITSYDKNDEIVVNILGLKISFVPAIPIGSLDENSELETYKIINNDCMQLKADFSNLNLQFDPIKKNEQIKRKHQDKSESSTATTSKLNHITINSNSRYLSNKIKKLDIKQNENEIKENQINNEAHNAENSRKNFQNKFLVILKDISLKLTRLKFAECKNCSKAEHLLKLQKENLAFQKKLLALKLTLLQKYTKDEIVSESIPQQNKKDLSNSNRNRKVGFITKNRKRSKRHV